MNTSVRIFKIAHKGSLRIRVDLPYDPVYLQHIKGVKGCLWSQSLKCWHVPYTGEAFRHLQVLFPGLEIIHTEVAATVPLSPVTVSLSPAAGSSDPAVVAPAVLILPAAPAGPKAPEVVLTIAGKKLILHLPKNSTDIQFIRSLQYARWEATGFCWLISHTDTNLALIRNYFKGRIQEIQAPLPGSTAIQAPPPKQRFPDKLLQIVHYRRGRMRLLFHYHKELIGLIKKLPYYEWDTANKWWTVPNIPQVTGALKDFCGHHGWEMRQTAPEPRRQAVPAVKPAHLPNYRECPEAFIERLTLKRYSWRTIKSYKYMFRAFINYYPTRKIEEITEKEIIGYLRYLVTECQVSPSYQNQAINAIKFYYEQVLGGGRKFYYVDRPHKEKVLPVVLS